MGIYIYIFRHLFWCVHMLVYRADYLVTRCMRCSVAYSPLQASSRSTTSRSSPSFLWVSFLCPIAAAVEALLLRQYAAVLWCTALEGILTKRSHLGCVEQRDQPMCCWRAIYVTASVAHTVSCDTHTHTSTHVCSKLCALSHPFVVLMQSTPWHFVAV